jgi:hypothetical protein
MKFLKQIIFIKLNPLNVYYEKLNVSIEKKKMLDKFINDFKNHKNLKEFMNSILSLIQ